MRKLAPAFLITSVIALASTSAFAMGDLKHKKSSDTSATTTQTSVITKKNAAR